MNNPSHLPRYYSIFFFLLLQLLLSIILKVEADDEDNSIRNCSSSFNCGIIKNIGHPFWGYNRAQYCGQPDFQLSCQDNDPKFIFNNSITYRILGLNSNDHTLRLVRDDYWKTICPSQYTNTTTFNSATFKLDDGFQNIALLYDCVSSFNTKIYQLRPATAECSDGNVYYGSVPYGVDLTGVCKLVVNPIENDYIGMVIAGKKGIQEAIEDGFVVRWSADIEECNKCVDSGGECGYMNQTFTCFCSNNNGIQGTVCSSGFAGSNSNKKIFVAIASAGGGVGMIVIMIVIVHHRKSFRLLGNKISKEKRTTYDDHYVETFMKTYGSLAPRKYTYSELRRISKSFTTKIGEGGYGVVYKATMPNDGRLVAVKVLNETRGNGEEFINEVASISRTSHVNIVSLLGFCYEKNKRALIYEFMPNGSLDKFIYKGEYSLNPICDFEWMRLYQISIGIARGLEYLHHGCNTRILHLDIKPQNILLDEDFCPKISDFGLVRVCQKKESFVSIQGMRGTVGYIAPEVFSRIYGGISYKSDVYSYGMLILEMIGGRKNFESGGSHTNSDMYFPNWIYKELEESSTIVSMNEEENEVVKKLTLVGLWCIQTNPANRPSMSKVVEMLEGTSEALSFPPKPSLSSPSRTLPLQLSYSSSSIMSHSISMSIPMETNS